jgi:dolichol-phosphate mannosyltransferase
MQKVSIVTGGAGFVGANVVRRLLREGHSVHLPVRSRTSRWRLDGLPPAVSVQTVDLSNGVEVERYLETVRPDFVFNLAAYGAYSWQNGLKEMLDVNVMVTANLLQAAAKAKAKVFVQAGSSSEYGYKNVPCAEDEVLKPNSEYAISKAAATHLCQWTATIGSMKTVVLRLYSVYGPFEDPRRFLPQLILRGWRGQFPPLVDPSVARDFVFVEDVCEAFMLAIYDDAVPSGSVYNIGSGSQTTIREAAEHARKYFGLGEEPRWGSMPDRKWDTSFWRADITAAAAQLHWRPERDFTRGFDLFAQWLRDHAAIRETYYELGASR